MHPATSHHTVTMLTTAAILLVISILISVPVLASPRREALRIINDAREANGCADLRPANPRLLASARRWSRRMANAGEIFHSVLHLGNWLKVGEVIGMGSRWRQIILLLFGSPEHRAILLDCDYDVVALGFAWQDQVWLTGRFYAR